MLDMAKGLKDINDSAIRNAAVIELQEKILAAREAQSALLDQVSELEKEVARLKAWEAEKERYELKALRDGDEPPIAYALKEAMAGTEYPHWICATCYQQNKKSLLQPESRDPGRCLVYVCHECGTDLYVQGDWMPEHAGKRRR